VLLGPGSSGAGAASKERRKSVGLGGRRSESLGRLAVTAEEDEEGEEEGEGGYADGDMEVEEVNYFSPVRDDEVEIMLGAGDSAAVLDGEIEGWKREM